jgi:EAL domain-containing protein (putative c-di-GMP-specific phosphodiesterase class I)
MLDPTLTRQRFEELRMSGFKLSVDDFGTGHSSLSYLLNFSFEYLKIDKSFIDHSGINDGYAVIASSMIQMAHKLNMIVICEGIETHEQKNMVIEWGADMLQGYLMSRPMPIASFYPKNN